MNTSRLFLITTTIVCTFSGCNPFSKPPKETISEFGTSVQMSITQGRTSNNTSPFLYVSGKSVIAFRYKFFSSSSPCSQIEGYSEPEPATTAIQVDVSTEPNGPLSICILGVDAFGRTQQSAEAINYDWIKVGIPKINISAASGRKGETISFLISQTSVSDYDTIVNIITQDDTNDSILTAHAGADFVANGKTLIIPAGYMTTNFIVDTLLSTSNVNKTFRTFLSNARNSEIQSASAIGTINP
jgi:hypothetical protein